MNIVNKLYQLALTAQKNAYCPYSEFAVGASVMSSSGKFYVGSNTENISYPCGTCAEQAAISAMATAGEREISEILIVADSQELITPCGACLQRIKEFSTPQTIIHLANLQGVQKSLNLNEFLPLGFSAKELKK